MLRCFIFPWFDMVYTFLLAVVKLKNLILFWLDSMSFLDLIKIYNFSWHFTIVKCSRLCLKHFAKLEICQFWIKLQNKFSKMVHWRQLGFLRTFIFNSSKAPICFTVSIKLLTALNTIKTNLRHSGKSHDFFITVNKQLQYESIKIISDTIILAGSMCNSIYRKGVFF